MTVESCRNVNWNLRRRESSRLHSAVIDTSNQLNPCISPHVGPVSLSDGNGPLPYKDGAVAAREVGLNSRPEVLFFLRVSQGGF